MRFTNGHSTRMSGVIPRTRSRRQIREQAGNVEDILSVAVPCKCGVFRSDIRIKAYVKVIHALGVDWVRLVVIYDCCGRQRGSWQRERIEKVLPDWAYLTRRDDVAGKLQASQRVVNPPDNIWRLTAILTTSWDPKAVDSIRLIIALSDGRVKQFREIAIAHELRRHAREGFSLRLPLAKALVIAEEEEAVAPDRSTQCAAELNAVEGWSRNTARNILKVVVGICVKYLIAVKEECRSVILVGARFDGTLDYSAAGAAELGRRHRSCYTEFLCSFHGWEKDDGADEHLIVVNAVQLEVVCLLTQAIDREGCPTCLTITPGLCVRLRWSTAGLASVGSSRYSRG